MDSDTKSELLEAAQHELMKHHWDTFCTEPLSIAEGGKGVIVRAVFIAKSCSTRTINI